MAAAGRRDDGRRDDGRRGCLLGLCDLCSHLFEISFMSDLIGGHSLFLLPLLQALLGFITALLCQFDVLVHVLLLLLFLGLHGSSSCEQTREEVLGRLLLGRLGR